MRENVRTRSRPVRQFLSCRWHPSCQNQLLQRAMSFWKYWKDQCGNDWKCRSLGRDNHQYSPISQQQCAQLLQRAATFSRLGPLLVNCWRDHKNCPSVSFQNWNNGWFNFIELATKGYWNFFFCCHSTHRNISTVSSPVLKQWPMQAPRHPLPFWNKSLGDQLPSSWTLVLSTGVRLQVCNSSLIPIALKRYSCVSRWVHEHCAWANWRVH